MDIERVDPALRPAARKLPALAPGNRLVRAALRLGTRVMPVPRTPGVTVSTAKVGGTGVRLYRPENIRSGAGLFWIHGGGLLFGDARQDELLCAETARSLGIPVVSANYRFAPEHPFPAAHDDVHAAWRWMQVRAADLGVDPARIVVGGESAGGGLGAALVQRLHDEGGAAKPIGQWLFAPMIDDRTAVKTSLDATDHLVWNNKANRIGWSGYVGDQIGATELPPYAAAARRADLSGLPPTYLAVGDIELFFAEGVEYARRLSAAGVPTELDIVPGAPHGFENWARDTAPAQALMGRAREWLGRLVAS
jgi:acetyl esterase/lipase